MASAFALAPFIVAKTFVPPKWFHRAGHDMISRSVSDADLRYGLTVCSISAQLNITPDAEHPDLWHLRWQIDHGKDGDVGGRVTMKTPVLQHAFTLRHANYVPEPGSGLLIERYGKQYDATAVCRGKFIRFGNFLNIPGPGTGANGDPNLSVYVRGQTMEDVRIMIKRR